MGCFISLLRYSTAPNIWIHAPCYCASKRRSIKYQYNLIPDDWQDRPNTHVLTEKSHPVYLPTLPPSTCSAPLSLILHTIVLWSGHWCPLEISDLPIVPRNLLSGEEACYQAPSPNSTGFRGGSIPGSQDQHRPPETESACHCLPLHA